MTPTLEKEIIARTGEVTIRLNGKDVPLQIYECPVPACVHHVLAKRKLEQVIVPVKLEAVVNVRRDLETSAHILIGQPGRFLFPGQVIWESSDKKSALRRSAARQGAVLEGVWCKTENRVRTEMKDICLKFQFDSVDHWKTKLKESIQKIKELFMKIRAALLCGKGEKEERKEAVYNVLELENMRFTLMRVIAQVADVMLNISDAHLQDYAERQLIPLVQQAKRWSNDIVKFTALRNNCLLYTSDAADE